MQHVLVSACLLGLPVRYDGKSKAATNAILQRWLDEGRVVALCPEVAGGLTVPRLPAEITNAAGGTQVIAGNARVLNTLGDDVSMQFVTGAKAALQKARAFNVMVAVLKEGSPSCGSGYTYDGSFCGVKCEQPGVTTTMLRQAGIQVFSEHQIADANALLVSLDQDSDNRG